MNVDPQLAHRPATRRTPWVVVAVVAGIAVLVPATICLVLILSLGLPRHYATVGEAQAATMSYYRAVQQHDYPAAYAYVDPQATTTIDGQRRPIDSADTLASIARRADQNNGDITGYSMVDGQFEPGTSIVDLTFQVTRTSGGQTVHIRIAQRNGGWKILQTDGV